MPSNPWGALEKVKGHAFGGNVTAIFRICVVVFALVGVPTSWVLQPFICAPNAPTQFFCGVLGGNVYEVLGAMLVKLVT